jgi:hypothetical protein
LWRLAKVELLLQPARGGDTSTPYRLQHLQHHVDIKPAESAKVKSLAAAPPTHEGDSGTQ